ncbi:MAG: SDR family NAD(P)-dependent oxidoreductase [Promethearchaeota archaeon]|nr:MAG: SDR family NAD(P)-dependent oxidoreductase [Candidatus Lokiarchaeota archaeon]
MKDLTGKNYLITGAANGIGKAFAKAFALKGMNLYLTDIDIERLEALKSEIDDSGKKVVVGKYDATNIDDFKRIAVDFQ